jgi:hypothetical protein
LCAVGPAHGLASVADKVVHHPVSIQLAAVEAVRKAGHCTRAAQKAARNFGKATSGSGSGPTVSRSGPLRMILM